MISPSVPPERPASPRLLLLVVALLALLLVPAAPVLAAPGTTPPGAGQGQGKRQGRAEDPPVWAGYPGTNEAHATYGYPWPAAPDCNEAALGGGCVNDGLGFFQGQCTSWVAHRLGQRNGFTFSNWYRGVHWGNASEWAKVAKSIGIKPNRIPAEGSVGWYARGHVSYVEAVNSDGSIVISEMNTDGRNGFHLVTVTPGGVGWPDKFIHFADVVPVDYTAPDSPPALTATSLDRGVQVQLEAARRRPGRHRLPRAAQRRRDRDHVHPGLPGPPGIARTGLHLLRDGVRRCRQRLGRRRPRCCARTPWPRPAAGRAFLPGSARLVLVRRTGRWSAAGSARSATSASAAGYRQRGAPRSSPPAVRSSGARRRARCSWPGPTTGSGSAGRSRRRGDAQACLPFDSETRSLGLRPGRPVARHRSPTRRGWSLRPVPHGAGCWRTGPSARSSPTTGWRAPRRAEARPTRRPVVAGVRRHRPWGRFCRVVQGRAACTELGRQGVWRATVSRGENVAHGRWVARRTGSALCPVGGGKCRTGADRPRLKTGCPRPRGQRVG